MTWVILLGVLLVLVGPLRRLAFGEHIRFTVPALVGGALGMLYGCWVQGQGATVRGLPVICAILGALIMGGEGKKILDEFFGGKGR